MCTFLSCSLSKTALTVSLISEYLRRAHQRSQMHFNRALRYTNLVRDQICAAVVAVKSKKRAGEKQQQQTYHIRSRAPLLFQEQNTDTVTICIWYYLIVIVVGKTSIGKERNL